MKRFGTDKFQGFCAVQEDGAGAKYMEYYDSFPRRVRERIRESPVNLCCMCVSYGGYEHGMMAQIERMERAALQQNDSEPR